MVGFDERRLLSAAAEQLGVDDPLGDTFRPAFTALTASLRDEARLSQVGAWRAGARIMGALGQRVALDQLVADEPSILEIPITGPIFITGLARAGGHLLHNLLARTPALWAPRLWELTRPAAPPRIDVRWIDRQIRTTEALLEQLYEAAPELRKLHPMSATSPEACSWLFRNSFSTLIQAMHWYMPSYVTYMLETDMCPAYRDHRRFLQVLSHRHRHDDQVGPLARLVLEDPFHLCHLDDLLVVYPDAVVIHVVCDPEEAVQGLSRTCWTLQKIDAKRAQPAAEVRRYCQRIVDSAHETLARAREWFPPHRFFEVPHAELVDDPLEVVRELGESLNLGTTEAALAGVSSWLSDHGQSSVSGTWPALSPDLLR